MISKSHSGRLIRSSRYLGYAPAACGDGWRVVGQDGGQSVPLRDGTLFLFSDTLIATGEAVRNPAIPLTRANGLFLANSAAVSREPTLAGALGDLQFYADPLGRACELIRATHAERSEGYRFWPQHGIEVGGRVYLFYLCIRQLDRAATWGFETAGSGLAILDPSTGDCTRVRHDGDWRLWRYDAGLHFGVQVMADGDWVYAFSSRQIGPFSAALLSRVRNGDIGDPGAWQHLSNTTPAWSNRFEDACELTYCGPEFSVSWNAYLGQYLMTYVEGYAKTLHLRTAPRLWGPYSEPYTTGTLPHRPESELISLGFEHPAFSAKGGETIFVSYCQPRFTQNALLAVTLFPEEGLVEDRTE